MTDSEDIRQLSFVRKPSPELQKNIDTMLAGFQALEMHFNKKIANQLALEGFRFPDLLEHSLRQMMLDCNTIKQILNPRYQYIKETEPASNNS